MTEMDLLSLARSATANEVGWFEQLVTINFAMIVAIYYFLNQARIGLRIVSFMAYTIGTLVFLGEILIESNLKASVLVALKALHAASGPTQEYIGIGESWLAVTTAVVFNSAFWILWVGIFYLLFFWKKSAHEPAAPHSNP